MKVHIQSYCIRKLRIEFLKEGAKSSKMMVCLSINHFMRIFIEFTISEYFSFRVIGQAATCIEKSLGMKFSMPSMNEEGN